MAAQHDLAVTYTNSHGVHEFRSRDINAPLPGSGLFPLGYPGPLFLIESSGLYNQNQVISNVNARVNGALSLFGFYVFNKAMSNTDGVGTFPANPYNFNGRIWTGVDGRAASSGVWRINHDQMERTNQPVCSAAVGRTIRYYVRDRFVRDDLI